MSKIKCQSCGKEVNSEANFCIYCGSQLNKSNGLLSKIINLFTIDKSPGETYDYFLSIKSDIKNFNDTFSKKEYITEKIKSDLIKDYNTKYGLSKKLKKHVTNSEISIAKNDLDILDLFIFNYENIDKKINEANKSVIDDFYNEFKENKQIYEDFIEKYDANISYDELISADVKKEVSDEYYFVKSLVNFEKTDNYDFGSDKKLIHDFVRLYENFEDIQSEINAEVNRRKNLEKDFENIKPNILEFIEKYDIKSSDVYVKDYKSILTKYKSYYETCLELNKYQKNYHDDSLSDFLSIYDNFEIHSKELNKKFIDNVYEEFLNVKDNVVKFVQDYKTRISYDELVSIDSKKQYGKEANICNDLKNYEKTDNYNLKENKDYIHDFVDIFYNFDKVVEKINIEVTRRKNIVLMYDENKNSIEKFIDTFKTNVSLDLYVEDYNSILDIYETQYHSCLELSKLPPKYHDENMSEFIELYDNFQEISNIINKDYLNYRYNLFIKNKSELINQINLYNPITVDDYLQNKKEFLDKFKNIYGKLKELIIHNYNISEDNIVVINTFFTLFDDFNEEFPSKFYKKFLNNETNLTNFISKYGDNSPCDKYIFDKLDVLKNYEDLYEISMDCMKLINSGELNSGKSCENLVKNFKDLYDNFDDAVIKNNSCYVEKLNNKFFNQKQSILDFLNRYQIKNSLDYYIDDKTKSEIYKTNKNSHDLCVEMENIPEINNSIASEFICRYDNLNEIIFEMNKNYVNEVYNSNKNDIDEYVSLINLSQNFYVSNSKLNELCDNHNHYLEIVDTLLNYCSEYDYLEDKSKLIEFPRNSEELIPVVSDANEVFIKRELKENKKLFDNVVKGKPLDDNQRRAVIIDEDNTQIIAGAGCGKTLTLQAKAKYLIERKGVNPEEILAISYSKLAQKDLDSKMSDIGANIDVSTFHSLGLNTLRKNKIKSNVLEYGLKDAIKEYFLVKIIDDVDKIQKIVEYFGYYMYEPLDKEKIENIGEVYDYERGMDLETLYSKFAKLKDPTLKKTTLQGEKVKSLEERRIANFLFINGVKYTYEKDYEAKIDWQKTYDYFDKLILKDIEMPETIKHELIYELLNYLEIDEILEWPRGGTVEKYHPDFYLDDYDIYYEHFGVNRKCLAPWLPRRQSREYKKEMRNKRFLHKKYGTKLIETYSYYQSENRLLDRLSEKLLDNGVEFKEIDYQQFMIDLLNDEEKINEYWDFIKLVETFISLFKGNGYQKDKFEEFRQKNEESEEGFLKEKHKLFLEIVEDIYNYYHEYLKKHNAIDFNDMINNATNILKDNDFYKDYKYIMVDEFQDTSHTRFNFLKTLKNKLNSKLIVVGDDWQSIYQFTGCDIDLFTNFENYFDNSKTEICYITNTYRNSQSLIDVTGNFIMKNESQFVKQLNSKSDEQINDTIKLYPYLNFLEQPFVFEVMINDIYKSSVKNFVKILVLGRNRKDYKALLNDELFYTSGSLKEKNLRIHYTKNPNILIKYMTVHGSKGLEEENVILINLEDRKNGFPNKIEDDSVLSFVKNKKTESIEFAEERRLFYVALTRTKQRSYLLAPKDKSSYFVNEIISDIEVVDYEIEHENEVFNDSIRVIASLDKKCPHCGTGKINLLLNPRTGKKFFKCSNWPKCEWYGGNFYENVEALDNPRYCPRCGGLLVKKTNGYGCMNYFPDNACHYFENFDKK